MSLLFVMDRQLAVDPNRCTEPSGHRDLSTRATCTANKRYIGSQSS